MLRVNVGLSRKLSRDFNSTGYAVDLEGEVTASVSDPEAVVEQIKELFDLAEEALNQQIERSFADSAIAGRDAAVNSPAVRENGNGGFAAAQHPQRGGENANQSNGHSDEAAATNKQVNFLLAIGKRQRLTTAQLEAKIAEILGRPVGLYDLTKKSAGVVLDALTNGEKQAAAPKGA